jgi:uncharacterized membrane protein YoaK (UPF0700 family)
VTPLRHLSLGLLLTATAGYIDAIGFVALGGYYTSFMSGNTTQIGAGLAHADLLVLPLSLVVLFFIGSYLGALIRQAGGRLGPAGTVAVVLVGIVTAIALAAAGFPPQQSMLALAAAAGAQNAVLQQVGTARLGATFVTGTLFAAGQDLAGATLGTAPRWRWAQHLTVWAALCIGALLGGLGYANWAMSALIVPAAVYALYLAWSARPDRA